VVAAQVLEHGFERVDRVLQTLARRPPSRVDAGKDSDVSDDGVLAENARQARDVFVRASLFILAVVARRAHQVQGRAKGHRFRRRRRWRRRHVSHVSLGGVRWFRGRRVRSRARARRLLPRAFRRALGRISLSEAGGIVRDARRDDGRVLAARDALDGREE